MLLFPVLVLLCLSLVESVPTFEHQDPFSNNTLICDMCPPGTHMVKQCTPTTPTKCAPCSSNHFTELWNYLSRCLYCNNFCSGNQEVEKECSAVSNRVCRCKEGFYLKDDYCMLHSECEPGHGVKTKGTSQTNTVCEACSDGYFSSSSSALDSCVNHQKCANGQTVLLPGTLYNDAVCGTCKDLENGGETQRKFLSGFFSMHRMRVGKMKKFVARYIIYQSDYTTPIRPQRDALQNQIRAWLLQAPVEELRKLPQMLKATQLVSMSDKLRKRLNEIEQQTPNCTLLM